MTFVPRVKVSRLLIFMRHLYQRIRFFESGSVTTLDCFRLTEILRRFSMIRLAWQNLSDTPESAGTQHLYWLYVAG